MMQTFIFPVRDVEKISDGDTYWLHVDVGFRQTMLTHLRLAGYDTPELYRPRSEYEKEQAQIATARVSEFIVNALIQDDLWVRTEKDPDSFGRWLGHIWRPSDSVVLGEYLEGLGLAAPWPQRWRDVYDTGT